MLPPRQTKNFLWNFNKITKVKIWNYLVACKWVLRLFSKRYLIENPIFQKRGHESLRFINVHRWIQLFQLRFVHQQGFFTARTVPLKKNTINIYFFGLKLPGLTCVINFPSTFKTLKETSRIFLMKFHSSLDGVSLIGISVKSPKM